MTTIQITPSMPTYPGLRRPTRLAQVAPAHRHTMNSTATQQQEDGLAPARGILFGLAICIPFWGAVAIIANAMLAGG